MHITNSSNDEEEKSIVKIPNIDASKIDNFVIDNCCKRKLLVLQIHVRSLANIVNFRKLEVVIYVMYA